MERSRKRMICLVILAAIILFQAFSNWEIISANKAYPYHTAAKAAESSWQAYQALAGDPLSLPKVLASRLADRGYPVLYYICVAIFTLPFGFSYAAASMANVIFIALLLLSVFGIGSILHSDEAGLVSAFILSMYPGIFAASRAPSLDFACAAAITFSVWILLRTKGFISTRGSVAFGISLCIAAGIKQTSALYLAGPVAAYVAHSFLTCGNNDLRMNMAKNLMISAAVGSLGLVFYLPVLAGIISHTGFSGSFAGSGMASIAYYPLLIAGTSLMLFFTAAFIAATAHLAYMRNLSPVLACWIAVPFLLLSFLLPWNSSPRFILGILPPMAIITACSACSIRPRYIRAGAIAAIAAIGMIQYSALSYMPQRYYVFNDMNYRLGLNDYPNVYFWSRPYGIFPPVMSDFGLLHAMDSDWGIGWAAGKISERYRGTPMEVQSFVPVVSVPLEYYFLTHGMEVDASQAKEGMIFGSPDFVILTNMSGLTDVIGGKVLEDARIAEREFLHREDYSLIDSLTLPDSSSMLIYARG